MRFPLRPPARLIPSFLVAALCVSASALATVEVGKPAPPIGLEATAQVPEGVNPSWESLKGKVVVLEFWATWCPPCVASIPHLNELAAKVKDKPVVFLAVSDESKDKVTKFFAKKPPGLKTWLGFDTDGSMMKEYDVRAIPKTILIDKEGRVAAITYPTMVTEEALDALIDGKALPEGVDLSAAEKAPARGGGGGRAREPAEAPLFQVVVRATRLNAGFTASNPNSLSAEAWTLRDAVARAYGVSPQGIVGEGGKLPDGFDTKYYSFEVQGRQPASGDRAAAGLRMGLEQAFGLTASKETREAEVLVLTAPAGGKPRGVTPSAEEDAASREGDSLLGAVAGPMSMFASQLESKTRVPVIDQTGMTGRYDWDIDLDSTEPEKIIETVRRVSGLTIEKKKQPMPVVVVKVDAAAKP